MHRRSDLGVAPLDAPRRDKRLANTALGCVRRTDTEDVACHEGDVVAAVPSGLKVSQHSRADEEGDRHGHEMQRCERDLLEEEQMHLRENEAGGGECDEDGAAADAIGVDGGKHDDGVGEREETGDVDGCLGLVDERNEGRELGERRSSLPPVATSVG